jgi:hypothetical protein
MLNYQRCKWYRARFYDPVPTSVIYLSTSMSHI